MGKKPTPTRRPFPTLSDRPEVAEFYEALGLALSYWQLVEEALYLLYERAVMPVRFKSAICGFHTLLFRSKLEVTNAAVRCALIEFDAPADLLDEWDKLCKLTGQRAQRRNDFAHFQTIIFDGEKSSTKAVRLCPPIHDLRTPAGIRKHFEYTRDDLVTNAKSFYEIAERLRAFGLKIPPPPKRRIRRPSRSPKPQGSHGP